YHRHLPGPLGDLYIPESLAAGRGGGHLLQRVGRRENFECPCRLFVSRQAALLKRALPGLPPSSGAGEIPRASPCRACPPASPSAQRPPLPRPPRRTS